MYPLYYIYIYISPMIFLLCPIVFPLPDKIRVISSETIGSTSVSGQVVLPTVRPRRWEQSLAEN